MDSMDPKGYCHGPPPPSSSSVVVGDIHTKTKHHQQQQQQQQLNSGNYINVMPMSVGVQYHRRKYSPQITPDYQ